jgi:hypothetical protein
MCGRLDMSLIQRISSRRLEDTINEGSRVVVTGTVAGGATDSILLNVADDRYIVVTGLHLSTNSATTTPVLVSLGLRSGSNPTITFFNGFLSPSSPVTIVYALGNWRYGDLGYDLVITVGTTTNTIAYTIDMRQGASPTPLGYIEQIGAKTHANPVFPDESGLARGQSEA